MSCPNCGEYGRCYCTWSEQAHAIEIIRQQQKEARRRANRPTVIEQEAKRLRKKIIRGSYWVWSAF